MTVYRLSELDHTISPVHTPNFTQWATLSSYLPVVENRNIYLNDLGENASDKYPPTLVAEMIKNGDIWIDWCGWPFWDYGSSAIQELMSILGYNVSPVDFNMGDVGDTSPSTNFERSLILPGPLTSPGIVNSGAPHGTAQLMHYGIIASGERYWYSSFAIKSGNGAYIYGFGNDSSYGLGGLGGYTTGIPISEYAPFISQILKSLNVATSSPAPAPVVTGPPSCPVYGTYYGKGTEAGTYVFAKYYDGYFLSYVVDDACNLKGGPYYHALPSASSSGSGGSGSVTVTTSSSGGSGSATSTKSSPTPSTGGSPVFGSSATGVLVAAGIAAGAYWLMKNMR